MKSFTITFTMEKDSGSMAETCMDFPVTDELFIKFLECAETGELLPFACFKWICNVKEICRTLTSMYGYDRLYSVSSLWEFKSCRHGLPYTDYISLSYKGYLDDDCDYYE